MLKALSISVFLGIASCAVAAPDPGEEQAQGDSEIDSTKEALGSCAIYHGACGEGMYGQPTYYLDRVSGNCPVTQPILNGFKFARCGAIDTPNEGLMLVMTCCAQ